MTEEATTSDAQVEGTEQVSTNAGETANTEVNKDESKDSIEYDLSKVPEEARDLVKEHLKNYKDSYVDKEFKRYLTKHTQERASSEKQRELEWKQKELEYGMTKQKLDQVSAIVETIMRDPNAYQQYRAQAGLVQQEPEKPKLETVEDLVSYLGKLEGEIQRLKGSSKEEVAQLARQQIHEYDSNQRYNNAVHKLEMESSIFKDHNQYILNLVKTDKELASSYNGSNEYEVLKMATEKFKNQVIEKESERVRQELLNSQKLKKTATTLPPQKNISTKPGGSVTSRDAIISKVIEKFGY